MEERDEELQEQLDALRRDIDQARAEADRRPAAHGGDGAGGDDRNRRKVVVVAAGAALVAAAGVGIGLAVSSGGGSRPATAPTTSPARATTTAGPPTTAVPVTTLPATTLPATTVPPTTVPRVSVPPTTGPPAPRPPAPRPAAAPARHVVQPGESLWSIATGVVRADLGPGATDAQISRYWAALIQANQAALAVSGDPDVIYAGTVLTLPALRLPGGLR